MEDQPFGYARIYKIFAGRIMYGIMVEITNR